MESNLISQDFFAFPVSSAQRRLWILSQFQGASAAYNILGVLHVKGPFRTDFFRDSVHYLTQRHESLRTAFEKEEEIIQVVHPEVDAVITFTTLPHGIPHHEALHTLMEQEINRPFNLEEAPLFRITCAVAGKEEHYIIFCMHHLISDGWSLQVFIRELSAAYNAFAAGNTPEWDELPLQYADYVLWQQEQADKGHSQQLEFWKEKLRDVPAILELPSDYTRPAVQTFSGDVVRLTLPVPLATQTLKLAGQLQATPYTVLLSVFNVLLFHYTQQEDIVVGSPVANRPRQELEDIIGLFVNTLPVCSRLKADAGFASLVADTATTVREAMLHQDVALEKILEVLPVGRVAGYHPLFQVMFSLHNFENNGFSWDGLETRLHDAEGFFSKFDITLSVTQQQTHFELVWEFNPDIFSRNTIQRMAGYFCHILQQVCNEPAITLRDTQLLDHQEKQELLYAWNQTEAVYPVARFETLFAKQVACCAGKIAVQDSTDSYSYMQLDQSANRLAHLLISRGVQAGQHVAVCQERNCSMLISLLGTMKAGAVYIPIDPAYPEERRKYLLEDANIHYVITANNLVHLFDSDEGRTIICTDMQQQELAACPDIAPVISLSAGDPVYMIYTSGSTGAPKGVRISHHALVNFLYSMITRPGIHENDRLLAVTSLSFDIAGLELFGPLLAGATVIIANRETASSASLLADCLEEQAITVMQATPATWNMLRDAGWEGKHTLKALCGGESFPRPLANWLVTQTAEVWNMYGPTETTIWSTVYPVSITDDAIVPLGKPIANTTCYILNQALQPVPPGVNGDLYIGGSGLAIDYYNRPELTAEKFITNPFVPGQQMYKTGDKARYLSDGNIVFSGRADLQVKVNGYRIEPGEIEYHLSDMTGVKQAVVVALMDNNGMHRLCAYIIPTGTVTVSSLREALQRRVPAHMVPSQWQLVDAFPLTPNGKINRKILQEQELQAPVAQTYEPPVTLGETILCNIWQEVLRVERVGVHDNFFELGGASLQSINVCAKAAASGMNLTPEKLFEYQTVRELARCAPVISGIHSAAVPELEKELLAELSASSVITAPKLQLPQIHIESFACYLPEKTVNTNEIVEGCLNKIRFPMQRLTGIHSRRETAADECAFGMAAKAMEHCFNMSRYQPADIDVLISCNVFRMDHPEEVVLEPGTAIRLAHLSGCSNAVTMDLSNACAGIFSAIVMAETMIRNGTAQRVMLVSGEYLTHLTNTAQKEITDFLDQSISALTVGDSGLAMILEAAPDNGDGFVDIDMFTMGGYSDLCIVKCTNKEEGGLLLKTDAIRMAEAGHVEASRHAWQTLKKNEWPAASINFLIMHQASSTTTANTMRQVNQLLNSDFANKENTIDNIKHRGNTATTTHWMAIQDYILNNSIGDHDRAMLFISGSGLNIGTALYKFDTLPSRVKAYWQQGQQAEKLTVLPEKTAIKPSLPSGVQIGSFAVVLEKDPSGSAIIPATTAARQCLEQQPELDKEDIGMVIYTGIYRDEHLFEPAVATILAGALDINATKDRAKEGLYTLCFDLFNSDLAWLQACFMATNAIMGGRTENILLIAGEMDNNAIVEGAVPCEVQEGGAAYLLQNTDARHKGFGAFLFRHYPALKDDIYSHVKLKGRYSVVERRELLQRQEQLLPYLKELVIEFLEREQLSFNALRYIIPPFPSAGFTIMLRDMLELPDQVAIVSAEAPLLKASLTMPVLLAELLKQPPVSGSLVLLISAGAGGQLGCALYHC